MKKYLVLAVVAVAVTAAIPSLANALKAQRPQQACDDPNIQFLVKAFNATTNCDK